jgi:predicted aldo/keto reductase-like oxidoreductase
MVRARRKAAAAGNGRAKVAPTTTPMKRRSFLKVVGGLAGTAAAGFAPELSWAEPVVSVDRGMPRRTLGRTGLKVSIVGFSGLALRQDNQEQCNQAVVRAFERGVNYYDVAPAYADGQCEMKLGPALQALKRDQFYLACKTKKRDAEGCRQELEQSLARLKTDHFDIYQLHHLVQPADVRKALGPDGAMETMLKAKAKGQVRFIGFSAHTTAAALEALKLFPFDTVMFPINYVEYFTRDFGKEVLQAAGEKKVAVLAIKPMHAGAPKPGETMAHPWWYRTLDRQEDIDMAWRFSLSLPGVVTGFAPSFLDLVDKAITAGRAYRPVDAADREKLQAMAEGQGSIFKREEDSVRLGRLYESPYPHRPHEADPEMWA